MLYSRTTHADMLTDIEVAFTERLPSSAITLRLQVDDASHEFKTKVREGKAKWNCDMYDTIWCFFSPS